MISIVRGDARRIPLADKSVQCVVTSPPYYGLRDYGHEAQIGLEKTPAAYAAELVAVFREVRRVLRDDGTVWLNIGDSYGAGGRRTQVGNTIKDGHGRDIPADSRVAGSSKQLLGIPWRVAFALQDDGWILRSDIIWEKPDPMPESCNDRPTKAHEYLFLLSKKKNYYYDKQAIAEPSITAGRDWTVTAKNFGRSAAGMGVEPTGNAITGTVLTVDDLRNKRSVWTVAGGNYPGAHFACMPPKLAEPCIMAGTSERGRCPRCGAGWRRVTEKDRKPTRSGANSKVNRASDDADSPYNGHAGMIVGNRDPQRHTTTSKTVSWAPGCKCPAHEPVPCVVFDPFGGAMTTLVVARQLGRHGVAVELSADYCRMGQDRLRLPVHRDKSIKAVRPAAGQGSLFD